MHQFQFIAALVFRRRGQRIAWKTVDHVLVLAAAHAEAGDVTVAVKPQKKAIEFYPRDDTQALDRPRQRLPWYESDKPSTFGN